MRSITGSSLRMTARWVGDHKDNDGKSEWSNIHRSTHSRNRDQAAAARVNILKPNPSHGEVSSEIKWDLFSQSYRTPTAAFDDAKLDSESAAVALRQIAGCRERGTRGCCTRPLPGSRRFFRSPGRRRTRAMAVCVWPLFLHGQERVNGPDDARPPRIGNVGATLRHNRAARLPVGPKAQTAASAPPFRLKPLCLCVSVVRCR